MDPLENHKATDILKNTGADPMENHKAIGFLRNTGLDPLENHKALDYLWKLCGPPGKSQSYTFS